MHLEAPLIEEGSFLRSPLFFCGFHNIDQCPFGDLLSYIYLRWEPLFE